MTSKQKRMKKAVEYLQNYMNTYSSQVGYLDYADETLIDDVLYGLGVALGPKRYAFAHGFSKFKARLLDHLANAERQRPDGRSCSACHWWRRDAKTKDVGICHDAIKRARMVVPFAVNLSESMIFAWGGKDCPCFEPNVQGHTLARSAAEGQ